MTTQEKAVAIFTMIVDAMAQPRDPATEDVTFRLSPVGEDQIIFDLVHAKYGADGAVLSVEYPLTEAGGNLVDREDLIDGLYGCLVALRKP